jgi:hypothetical protein
MNGMEDFIDVSVTRMGREIARGCYKLPVTIGRMPQNSICIGDRPTDKTVSRVHAQIERSGERLRLIDRSVNGTSYRGRLLKAGDVVELENDDSFEIRDFKIKVARAKHDPSIPALFEARIFFGDLMKGKPLLVGEMVLLCSETPDGLRFELVPAVADWPKILVRHRLDGEHPFAAIVNGEGAGMLVTSPTQERPPMTVNRRPVTDVTFALHPRCVIGITNVRIELSPPRERSLKCPNPACQLLNPYDPHTNCVYCGFRLVGAVTRTPSTNDRSG